MPRSRLIPAALAFAVMWTALMLWWNAPQGLAGIAILAIAGAICGLAWSWLFAKLMRRFAQR